MMKLIRRMPWWAALLIMLVAVDIVWRCWALLHPQAICSTAASISGKPLLLMADHRSNVDVFSLRKDKAWEAIYAEMDMNNDGVADALLHYLDGRDVFNVHVQAGQRPKFDVYFYGPGKSVTWWLDRGGAGAFTDRIFYDNEGRLTRHEALVGSTWRTLETRGSKKGVVIEGRWIPLQMTTNGWVAETPDAQ